MRVKEKKRVWFSLLIVGGAEQKEGSCKEKEMEGKRGSEFAVPSLDGDVKSGTSRCKRTTNTYSLGKKSCFINTWLQSANRASSSLGRLKSEIWAWLVSSRRLTVRKGYDAPPRKCHSRSADGWREPKDVLRDIEFGFESGDGAVHAGRR